MSSVEYRHPSLRGLSVPDNRSVDLEEQAKLRRQFDAARARYLATQKSYLDELGDHRAIHQQSRFRWDAEDVMSSVTWNTWGRIDFTELKHLAWLAEWRQKMLEHAVECQYGMAGPLREALPLFGANTNIAWKIIGDAVDMTPLQFNQLLWFYDHDSDNTPWTPNSQVRRIHKMGFGNPLIRIWEVKQLWAMYMAAVDVHEDTLVDLIEELRPTHRMSDILRAADIYNEDRLAERIAAARGARGGPNDPRRVPRQTFTDAPLLR